MQKTLARSNSLCPCGTPKTDRAAFCRPCANRTNRTHKSLYRDKVDRYEFEEEIHLWETPEFIEYAALVLGTFDSDWTTIGAIHRKLGLLKHDRWTLEALRYIGTDYYLEHKHYMTPELYRLGGKR